MTRLGQNPAKFVDSVAKPKPITVALTSYIPSLSGYYAQSLEVLQHCLDSLRRNTQPEHDVLIFDNASCDEVRNYLSQAQRAGQIQYLLLADRNLGKGGAWDFIFAGAPGELIAYSDSDVLFGPGWLQSSLEILEAYPRVGMVTARPLRTKSELYGATTEWARSTPEVQLEQGQFIPWEAFLEFDLSLGQSEAEIRRRYESTQDLRLTYRGVPALVGASHFQFTGRKTVLAQLVPLDMQRPMGQVRQLDQRLNELGYLRLSTTQALVQHMGNRVPPSMEAAGRDRPSPPLRRRGLLGIPLVRRLLLGIYDRIFRLYFVDR